MPDLRARVIRLASSNPELRPHLLPLVQKQAGPKVTRAREGFIVEGGDWPQFIIDNITQGRLFAAQRPPDMVEGTANYHVKPRSPDVLCSWNAEIPMFWGSPTTLVNAASMAYFEPMGRSLEDFTKLIMGANPRAKVSTKGSLYQVQYADPGRNPIKGLVQITEGPSSMYQKIPLVNLKRDGVVVDAPIQIGGTLVGTVLIPKGLAPGLEDLRGLFK